MAELGTITGTVRERTGKGAARQARREGRVPGVVYGGDDEPLSIAVDRNVLERVLHQPGFFARLFELNVGSDKISVLARDIQLHPVNEVPLHVDFLRVAKDAKIEVEIPVHFLREEASPGLKRGGVLNIVRHEVELLCPANAIPEFLEVDLTGLEIGDSVHIPSIALPEGVTPTITDRDFTVATFAAPTVQTEGEEAEEAAEEAEVAGGEEEKGGAAEGDEKE